MDVTMAIGIESLRLSSCQCDHVTACIIRRNLTLLKVKEILHFVSLYRFGKLFQDDIVFGTKLK
jgi:hypothetical protein